MKKILLLAGIVVLTNLITVKAQVTIGSLTRPDSSAVLDLQSNGNRGLLLPRVILTDTLVADPVIKPKQGLFVYNTKASTDGKVVEGVYYFDGHRWWPAGGSGAEPWQVSNSPSPTKATLNTQNIYQIGAVAVGIDTILTNTTKVPLTKLNVNASDKGIMIPRMDSVARNKIPVDSLANSLLIYNISEDCYNYYSKSEKEWQSLCGKLGKALFSIPDCSTNQVFGQYLTKQSLGTSNYIKVTVKVDKPGSYSVTAMPNPDNGYYFSASGEFLTAGMYDLILQGAGTPLNFTPVGGQGDLITFMLNGVEANCHNTYVKVDDSTIKPLYSMICSSVQVNGVYKINTALNATNTITLQLNVDPAAAGATYMIETNTVDGIKFSGAGILTAGIQTITLNGSGKPNSFLPKTMTITNNSQSDVSVCYATVIVAFSAKKVLSIGQSANGYGYSFNGTAQSNKLITTPTNYGVQPTSIIKVDGITLTRSGDFQPNDADLLTALNENPDIVITGYIWNPSATQCKYMVDYLAKGGTMLVYMEAGNTQLFLRTIFGTNEISVPAGGVNAAGAVYQFPYVNDEIMNGPFGDIRGLQWGEDASNTFAINNIPTSQITMYSNAYDISGTPYSGSSSAVTAFKHNTLNLIFVCDGGFNSSSTPTPTYCPFLVGNATVNGNSYTNYPLKQTNYGRNAAARYDVYNAIFTANAFAWAIKQAQFNGINK